MMCRFMHPECTTFFFQPMPASEVIGTVAGIEVPMKIYRREITDHTAPKQLIHFSTVRRIAIVKRNRYFLSGLLFSLQNGFTLLLIRRHRFFRDDIGTQLHSTD